MPEAGVWRIHMEPQELPSAYGPDETPPNRYDDPLCVYRVLYFATSKRGSFLEVLGWFRRHPRTEEMLAAVDGVDEESEPILYYRIPPALLAHLRQVRAFADGCSFVDVADPRTLTTLDRASRVRIALDASALGSHEQPAELDQSTIRLSGTVGRAITQAASRHVFEETDACGIRYTSRFDVAEECWAVYDVAPMLFWDEEPIAFDDPDLVAAAAALAVRLP